MLPITRTFAAASTFVLAVLAATPVSAAGPDTVTALGLDQAAPTAATSEFYAGYADTGVGSGATSADFTVPEVVCGATNEGMATTLYAISADGEFLAGADLFWYCDSGEYVLDGHITTSGGQIPIWQQLEPGDKIRLSIVARSEGPSTHDVSFENLTRGWTSTLPTNSMIKRIEVAYRRMSLNGTQLAPPQFGRSRVTNVVFDDVAVSAADAVRTNLVDADGDLLVRTRKAHGEAFRLVSRLT